MESIEKGEQPKQFLRSGHTFATPMHEVELLQKDEDSMCRYYCRVYVSDCVSQTWMYVRLSDLRWRPLSVPEDFEDDDDDAWEGNRLQPLLAKGPLPCAAALLNNVRTEDDALQCKQGMACKMRDSLLWMLHTDNAMVCAGPSACKKFGSLETKRGSRSDSFGCRGLERMAGLACRMRASDLWRLPH
jgi:hypothetical protein